VHAASFKQIQTWLQSTVWNQLRLLHPFRFRNQGFRWFHHVLGVACFSKLCPPWRPAYQAAFQDAATFGKWVQPLDFPIVASQKKHSDPLPKALRLKIYKSIALLKRKDTCWWHHQIGPLQFSHLPRRNSHPKWLKWQRCRPEKLWYARVYVISIHEGPNNCTYWRVFKKLEVGIRINWMQPTHHSVPLWACTITGHRQCHSRVTGNFVLNSCWDRARSSSLLTMANLAGCQIHFLVQRIHWLSEPG
jgi:hypothetical protein